jgi:hypothetical protein
MAVLEGEASAKLELSEAENERLKRELEKCVHLNPTPPLPFPST